MKIFLAFSSLVFLFLGNPGYCSPETEATQRAKEFAHLFATERAEPQWLEKDIPEYWHPQGNDSGLPSRYPSFLPTIDTPRGNFLFTMSAVGRALSGRSPWLLEGKESVWCIEILFTVVAQVGDRVTLFNSPRVMSQFFVMALDTNDGKWKNLDSYPDRANYYEIPYFLKSWEKILGKGSVKNIPEVQQKLLDLVKK